MKQLVSKRENMCCRRLLRPRTVTQCRTCLRNYEFAIAQLARRSLEAPDIQISLLGILSRCAGGRPRQFLEITHCGLCRARVAL
jgi:hypothetical protein